MRTLEIGTQEHTQVNAMDERGPGNANHCYEIVPSAMPKENEVSWCQPIAFQRGPVKEAGVNGIHNEDLIAIVIDRLAGFQAGEFACDENAEAKCLLEKALLRLRRRTNEREARGVEGTHAK